MLLRCLLDAAERIPGKAAARDGVREVTYAQLVTLSRVMARLVIRESRCEGVGIMLPASVAALGTILGTLWAGRIAIPLNFLLPARELAAILADAGIDLVIATRHFKDQLAQLPVKAVYLEDLPLKRAYLVEKLRSAPPIPHVDPHDTAAIIYTSGSTGQPKGVCLTHNNLLTNCQGAIEHFQMTPEHHVLGIIPPFHVFGLTCTTLLPVVLRATVTFLPRFSPQAIHKSIRDSDISIIMAVASMYGAIARLKQIEPADFKRLVLTVSGGEPLPRRTYDDFLAKTGVSLLEGYGLTETSPVVSSNQPWANKIGTVGRPIRDCELLVRDEAGRSLPIGQEGELWVRGPMIMKGYFNRPEETAAVIDKDGWFRTGDIVRLDEESFIKITGRAKEMMIVGGENVFPREVESVLEQHPAVFEVGVIGRLDHSRGEVVVAFVALKDGAQATADELREFSRQRLAGYKTPRELYILESLPHGPTGKILKRELKARLGG
ncbi:MAG: AMP-binding protein [Phycisphaerae bacterium]|nr:AMP-binding protein [Phycisphaerae bacterium]